MRYRITDDLWATLGPAVEPAKRHTCGAKPDLPDRMFLEALLYWARTGVPWRDLPAEFGAWDAVYHRFRRWVTSGRLAALFDGEAVAQPSGDGEFAVGHGQRPADEEQRASLGNFHIIAQWFGHCGELQAERTQARAQSGAGG